MWDQEKEHLQKFEQIIAERRVRPTVLVPLWNIAGYVLGTVRDVSVRKSLEVYVLASYACLLLVSHKRLHDEPKECLRRRLYSQLSLRRTPLGPALPVRPTEVSAL